MAIPDIPADFDDLSTSEKIEYVQRLWDRIASESGTAELTDEQREELARRLEAHHENPDEADSWESVRERLRGEE